MAREAAACATIGRMRLRIFTEPQQGASYATLRRVAKATEDLGFDAFFRSDHYLKMGSVSGEPGPSDAWATLAGLAVETSRIRLGTLVTSATFRYPGPLADRRRGHRRDERRPGRARPRRGLVRRPSTPRTASRSRPSKERFDRLEEQLAIITGLWETPPGEKFSYEGTYYQVTDSPGLPKPVQRPRPPVIIGGHGPRRTPALAARYADEFNIAFSHGRARSPRSSAGCREACAAAGRDPAALVYSAAQVVCCGKDEATLSRRAAAIGRDGGRAARQRPRPARRPRSSTRSARSPRRARRPSTCRSSTSTTSTTWPTSPPRCCPRCDPVGNPRPAEIGVACAIKVRSKS